MGEKMGIDRECTIVRGHIQAVGLVWIFTGLGAQRDRNQPRKHGGCHDQEHPKPCHPKDEPVRDQREKRAEQVREPH